MFSCPALRESVVAGPGRTVQGDSTEVDCNATPDTPEEVQRKLAASLDAARRYAEDCPAELRTADFVPFALQKKVESNQQVFMVTEGLYVASEYGASDLGLLQGLGISRVINISSGSRTVPNYGESTVNWDVEYRHYPLEDRIGYSVSAVEEAFVEAIELIEDWLADGQLVLVHCSAGLSRSASMVMAFLMSTDELSLHDAVQAFTTARGRQPACTPTYWTVLMKLERNLCASARKSMSMSPSSMSMSGVVPSFDFTPWICDDVGGQGEQNRSTGLQIATDDTVANMLHNEHDWDADAVVHALLG